LSKLELIKSIVLGGTADTMPGLDLAVDTDDRKEVIALDLLASAMLFNHHYHPFTEHPKLKC
jgi:hypothetical protein